VVSHPAVGFSGNHLAGREEMPNVSAADLKVAAGGAAEDFQNLGRR
jgi:hypothetical protein